MKLRFHTFSGMQVPITTGELDEVREAAANYLLRAHRVGYDITTLQKGREWEIITTSNSEGFMVTDHDGILQIHD